MSQGKNLKRDREASDEVVLLGSAIETGDAEVPPKERVISTLVAQKERTAARESEQRKELASLQKPSDEDLIEYTYEAMLYVERKNALGKEIATAQADMEKLDALFTQLRESPVDLDSKSRKCQWSDVISFSTLFLTATSFGLQLVGHLLPAVPK